MVAATNRKNEVELEIGATVSVPSKIHLLTGKPIRIIKLTHTILDALIKQWAISGRAPKGLKVNWIAYRQTDVNGKWGKWRSGASPIEVEKLRQAFQGLIAAGNFRVKTEQKSD